MSPLIAETIIQEHERRVQANLRAPRARAAAPRGRTRQPRVRQHVAHGLLWAAGRLDPCAARGRRPAAPC